MTPDGKWEETSIDLPKNPFNVEAGRRGGERVKQKYGPTYYQTIAQKAGLAVKEKYGPEHFAAMGRKGGATTRQRQPSDYYRTLGRMGVEARRRKKAQQAAIPGSSSIQEGDPS